MEVWPLLSQPERELLTRCKTHMEVALSGRPLELRNEFSHAAIFNLRWPCAAGIAFLRMVEYRTNPKKTLQTLVVSIQCQLVKHVLCLRQAQIHGPMVNTAQVVGFVTRIANILSNLI